MTFEEILPEIIPNREETVKRFSGNVELLEKFVRKFPQYDTWLKFKQIAGDDNWGEMEMVAHTLKGYSGNIGFQSLYELCTEIVKLIREKKFDAAKKIIPEAVACGEIIEKHIAQIS